MKKLAVSILCVFVLIGSSSAQVADQDHSEAQWGTNAILVNPDGSGELLSDVGNEVHIWLRDSNGAPIPNVAADSIQLHYFYVSGNDVPFCPGLGGGFDTGLRATTATDSNGHAFIDGTLLANDLEGLGFAGVEIVAVAPGVSWRLYWGATEDPVTPVSPDVNGDFVVNLSDISPFATLWNAGNLRVDYDHDGSAGLSDISIFAAASGAACP